MESLITQMVEVNVVTTFQPRFSKPSTRDFLFSYQVTITNLNYHPVKLLRRSWKVFDSNGETRNIEGEGVIGEQPVIQSGESYTYRSICNLKTDIGKMLGSFIMERQKDNSLINVRILEFTLIAPNRLN